MHLSTVPTATEAMLTGDGGAPPSPDLIGRLGGVAGAHVAVIGAGSLETMCALIRAGCAAVVEIAAATARAPLEPVEYVVSPQVNSVQAAAQAMPVVMRALLPGGRIALRNPAGLLGAELAAMLRAHGFSGVRVHASADGCVVVGERPIFGKMTMQARA